MNTITEIIKKQHKLFSSGVTEEIPFRYRQLRTLSSLISANREKIVDAMVADFQRPQLEIVGSEYIPVLNEIDTALRNIHTWSKRKKYPVSLLNFPSKAYSIKKPLGVCLIISPWNYPFRLLLLPLVSSIAAGNCSICKPSEFTPHINEVLKELLFSKFDSDYISFIEGDKDTVNDIIDVGVDLVFFTGSKSVGSAVMTRAAQKTIPVVLELGGKNPCIIDKSTNPVIAARRVVWGKFFNAGQTCVAPDYCLVHRDIMDQFIQNSKRSIEHFFGKDPKHSSSFGRIVNERHFDRIVAMLGKGRILIGGNYDRETLYIAPTLIDSISSDSSLLAEEIFGPLLPIISYSEINEAISIIKSNPLPLACNVFSSDNKILELIDKNVHTGNLCINGTLHLMMTKGMPFGGVGASGFGRYHGKAGFDTFSYEKAILCKSIKWEIPANYPPYRIAPALLHTFRKLLF